MSMFDPIKALKEEIAGLVDTRLIVLRRERELTAKYGELGVEMNAIVKIRGFADAELERKRTVLKQLEDQNANG